MLLSRQHDEVFRMRDAPPPGQLYFNNPSNPPGCPRQVIQVQLTEPGLYQYYCEPPFSQLVRLQNCRCAPRRRDPDEPDPPIVADPRFEPRTDPKSTGEPKGKSNGQPSKGNGQPGKGNGKPGKGNGEPKRPPTPGEPPRWAPEINATIAAIIVGLAALAIRASKYFKPLQLAVILGALLGSLLKGLGIGLAVAGGTVESEGGTGDPSKGKPVRVPVDVPSGTSSPTTSNPWRNEIVNPGSSFAEVAGKNTND